MRILLKIVALLVALPVPAQAADILINNGLDCSISGNVIDDTTYQNDTVYVRDAGCGTPDPWSPCSSPGAATEVCVVVGGLVDVLYSYDSSVVTMTGGTVTNSLVAHDSSAVSMNGGNVDTLGAYQTSSATMDGGEANFLYAADSSTGTMDGGKVWFALDAFGSGAVTLSGGKVWDLRDATSRSTGPRFRSVISAHRLERSPVSSPRRSTRSTASSTRVAAPIPARSHWSLPLPSPLSRSGATSSSPGP
jgi:hypothetical protein